MKLPTASLIFFNAISRGSALRGATHEDSNSAASRPTALKYQGPHPLDRHLTEDGEEPWAAYEQGLKRTRDHAKLPGGGFGGDGKWALDDSPNDSPDDTTPKTEGAECKKTFEIINGDLYEVCESGMLAGLESAPQLAGNVVEAPGDLDRQKNIWDFVSTFDGSYKTSSLYEL